MFRIRSAQKGDLEGLYRLAGKPGFLTLSKDRGAIAKKIALSEKSFAQNVEIRDAEYLFVLEDMRRHKIIGTSLIIAQHGRPDSPHVYFRVLNKRKKSRSLKMCIEHEVLRLGYDYDGPTEIGGLMLNPRFRGHEEKLGKFLSYCRFMYMSARKGLFRDEVLSELLPPFDRFGNSPIWEDIGRKFTGLSYVEADRLSQKDNEFIPTLFPEGDVYTCMMSNEAREAVGQVGPETVPVKRMLEKIGFRYRDMIDPFDGGPHYWARLVNIAPVKKTKRIRLSQWSGSAKIKGKKEKGYLMGVGKNGAFFYQGSFFFRSRNDLLFNPEIEKAIPSAFRGELYFLRMPI